MGPKLMVVKPTCVLLMTLFRWQSKSSGKLKLYLADFGGLVNYSVLAKDMRGAVPSTCVLLLLLLLLLQIRTQHHLGCCLAAATASASAIFMHLCSNCATPCTSRQHMRSCNDVNGNCANRRSRLTTAAAVHCVIALLLHIKVARH
jgi:hypothetical protein